MGRIYDDTLIPEPTPRRRNIRSAKAAGTAAETAVVRYLRTRGWLHAERRAKTGQYDQGDITGLPGVVIEVKNCRHQELAKWITEALVEKRNARADIAAVWHKRMGKTDPADWYVTMTGAQFAELLAEAQGFTAVVARIAYDRQQQKQENETA